MLSTLVAAVVLAGCSGDSPDERRYGAVSSFAIRQFVAPGQPIAQMLDAGGRCLIFLELTNVEDGSPNDIDPSWVFELSIIMSARATRSSLSMPSSEHWPGSNLFRTW